MKTEQLGQHDSKPALRSSRPKAAQINDMLNMASIEWPEEQTAIQIAESFTDFRSLKVTKNRFKFKDSYIKVWPSRLDDGERILATTSYLFPQWVWFFHHLQGRGIRLLSPGALLGAATYGPPPPTWQQLSPHYAKE